jgi:hypothetical protein
MHPRAPSAPRPGARTRVLGGACLLAFLASSAGARTLAIGPAPQGQTAQPEAAPQAEPAEEIAPPPSYAALPPELAGADVAYLWTFDRDGERLGWKTTSPGLGETMARDGRLHAEILGPDPYVTGPRIRVDSAAHKFLALRCRSTVDGLTEIFFSREAYPGFYETQMIRVPMKAGDEPRVY